MYFRLGALFLLGSVSLSSALPPCVCTRNFKPVCGSDGRTYNNECLLHCAQVTDPNLVMEKNGRCDGSSLHPEDCICTLEYMPHCGTDGKTYPNHCSLDCAKRSSPVEIAHLGECGSNHETVQVAELPSRCSCPRNFAPVCGSDGKTYDNGCVLDCISQNKPDLTLLRAGACDYKPCSCPSDVVPVCGSNGITYDNLCLLRCAMENYNDIAYLHDGECDTGVKVANSCTCTRNMSPVCGTDGNTYNNPCLLDCARANDASLLMDHEGPCDNSVKVVEHAEINTCACTRNMSPVCASNGMTFNNKCLMRCASTHLTVAKDGPCEE